MDRKRFSGVVSNGYMWWCYKGGIHIFKKPSECGEKWYTIECTKEQIRSGEIHIMTANGYTMSKEAKANYLNSVV